jgi:F0F1-type ATP synthase membrane subunit b/b'
MNVDTSMLTDPVFIAKIVNFVVFVVVLVWAWNKIGVSMLTAQQEAQNKAVEDAARYREESEQALRDARAALEAAKTDATRMVEIGTAQAARLVTDERGAAQDHAKRILAHAGGELERERYRVRRVLLEETVERAHAEAQAIVKREVDPTRQRALVERLMDDLERSHV